MVKQDILKKEALFRFSTATLNVHDDEGIQKNKTIGGLN